ncbi:MAG: Gfo/Idh/MocA family oxidoreductase [Chitinophagales bacterium]
MIKVGLIGCGTMGRVHGEAYAALPGARLMAVTDVRRHLAEEVAAFSHAEVMADAEALIARPELDAIDICVPTPLHKDLILKAAASRKHIFTEKPLARTLDEGREVLEAVGKAGVKLMVGHVLRFSPPYQKAREALTQGRIGRPGVVRTTRGGGGFPTAWQDWYASIPMSGGIMLDMLIHDLDFLRWCFGDVERVYAKTTLNREIGRYEYALIVLRFKSGVIAHVEGTWHDVGGFFYGYEIAGDGGLLSFDSRTSTPIRTVTFDQEAGRTAGVAIPENPTAENPYQLEISHFVDCLESGTEPAVTGEDGYKAMEIALAAIKSAETGEPVTL